MVAGTNEALFGVNEHKFCVQFLLPPLQRLSDSYCSLSAAFRSLIACWSLQLFISYSGGVKVILCSAELCALQFLITFETNLP